MDPCPRLGVEIERLLPCVSKADGMRRLIFAREVAAKMAEFESNGGDAERLAGYEEALLRVVESLSPAPAPQPPAAKVSPPAAKISPPAEPPRRRKRTDKTKDVMSLEQQLERMAAQLKASSLEMHAKLTDQTSIFDRIDQATLANETAVVRERDALTAQSRNSNRALFSNIASLLFVGLTFAFTYVFISAFPK